MLGSLGTLSVFMYQSRIVINFDNHYQNKPLANHCSNSRPRDIIDHQLRENSIWRTIGAKRKEFSMLI